MTAGVSPIGERRALTNEERLEEALFTGLRLTEGMSRAEVTVRYGVDPLVQYGESLAPFLREGFMWAAGDRFGLTRSGMLLANEILTTFV